MLVVIEFTGFAAMHRKWFEI